jgi:predicted transposase/invertase (TIGR01784 family)
MKNKELQYTFKTDIVFKMLFAKRPELLKSFISELLKIEVDSIEEFVIRNPEILPENLSNKFSRLDINMKVTGQIVNLEVQVQKEDDYSERTMYYWSKNYSAALLTGEKYSELPIIAVISIVDFTLFDCEEYHSEYRPLEVKRHTLLSDKMVLHYYELGKLREDLDPNNKLELWLSLFKANTEEELKKIEEVGVPEMELAIEEYRNIIADDLFKQFVDEREKAGHDEAQALYSAEKKGEAIKTIELIREKTAKGISVLEITDMLELDENHVHKVRCLLDKNPTKTNHEIATLLIEGS